MFKIHRIDLNLKQYPNYYLSSINFNPADQFHTIITCSCYDKHLRYFKLEQARKIIEIQQNKFPKSNFKYTIEYDKSSKNK